MANLNFYQRFMRMQSGNPISTGELSDDMLTTPTASANRFTAGTGVLASGTVAVATGLTTITSFVATDTTSLSGAGNAGNQLLQVVVGAGASGGTGTVTAYYVTTITGAAVIASGSSGSFNWIAVGT